MCWRNTPLCIVCATTGAVPTASTERPAPSRRINGSLLPRLIVDRHPGEGGARPAFPPNLKAPARSAVRSALQSDTEQSFIVEASEVRPRRLSFADNRVVFGDRLRKRVKTPVCVDIVHNDGSFGSQSPDSLV